MTSAEHIREHVKHLQQRLEKLLALQGTTLAEYAADSDRRDLIEHNLRIAIESCSDIALLVVARLGLPEPAHRRDVYEALTNAGKLPKGLAQKLADLTSLRNRLVHRYMTVDPVTVLDHLHNSLKDIQELAGYAIGWADELERPSTNAGSEAGV